MPAAARTLDGVELIEQIGDGARRQCSPRRRLSGSHAARRRLAFGRVARARPLTVAPALRAVARTPRAVAAARRDGRPRPSPSSERRRRSIRSTTSACSRLGVLGQLRRPCPSAWLRTIFIRLAR